MNATPGMTATLEIKTGQKTLLEYLLRPCAIVEPSHLFNPQALSALKH